MEQDRTTVPSSSIPEKVTHHPAPIPILAYHQTAALPSRGVPWRTFTLAPAAFRSQLLALRRMGYIGLSMRDLEPYLRGEKLGKVVGITLDDGYVNNFEQALPILREVGFTATSFMVSGQFGGSNLWDQRVGVPPAALMNVDQLKAWIAAGMEVGAHTRNHVNLPECDATTAFEEIAGAKHDLEAALDCEVRNFCYPYGAYRPEHAAMVEQAGYVHATTSDHQRVQSGTDPRLLPRISVFAETTVPLLLAQVATGFEDWRWNRSLQRAASASSAVPAGASQHGALAS